MRHDEARAAAQQRDESVLQARLGERVDRARRLVENHKPRIGDQRARETHDLPLADGQARAVLAHLGVQTLRQRLEQIEDVELRRRGAHVGLGRVGFREADIFEHRAAEEKILLLHHAHLPVQRVARDRPHLATVEK